MRSICLIIRLLFVLLSAASCSKGGPGDACSADGQCRDGLYCTTGGVCWYDCHRNGNCDCGFCDLQGRCQCPDGDGGLAADGGPVLDGGAACRITVDYQTGRLPLECAVEAGSQSACADFIDCFCRDNLGQATQTQLDQCIGEELTARAMVTMADFCDQTMPARNNIQEAVTGYLSFRPPPESLTTFTAGCSAIPALTGPTPYAKCLDLAGWYCPCIPGICDPNSMLGTRCAALSLEEVKCVADALGSDWDQLCEKDPREILRQCRTASP